MRDKNEIIKSANIVSVVGSRISLSKQGREYVGLCPFHKDKHPSFKVNESKGIIKCFPCGWSGDAASFIMDFERVDFKTALDILEKESGAATPMFEQSKQHRKKPTVSKQISPVPADAPEPSFFDSRYGMPVKKWKYTDRFGATIGYVCRFEPEGEQKQVKPYTYRDGSGWTYLGFETPRPLFNLHAIASNPEAVAIVFEGEKPTEIAQQHLPLASCTTWIGGTAAVKYTDWSPLFGRKQVMLVPDNDYQKKYADGTVKPWLEQPGIKAMLEIYEILKPHVESIIWVSPPMESQPCGWDVADRNWQQGELRSYLLTHRTNPPGTTIAPADNPAPSDPDPMPFVMLGFLKNGDTPKYCFFSSMSKTIVTMGAAGMGKLNLMNLAPIQWWEKRFPSRSSKSGFDIDSAAQWLISESSKTGIFSESRIRGRGAWMDAGRTVIHAGDKLIVDGVEISLHGIKSKYVYEQGYPLDMSTPDPINSSVSVRIIDMLSYVSWQRPVNAYLLAGWCVIAPVCGALKWRPHIWLTAPADTGKSWLLKNVIRPLLGETGIYIQGQSTSAGIRAMLGHDALPVTFDEADSDTHMSKMRIEAILELIRSASSEDGGKIALGASGGGRGNVYEMKSCFAFASISPQASQQSDKSRITLLELKQSRSQAERDAAFEKITSLHAELMTEDFVRGLHARTIKLLPIIIKNSETFNRAAKAVLKGTRHGDQIGPMLAGAYSLNYDTLIDFESAKRFIQDQDWSEESAMDMNRDEYRLFAHISEQIVDVETDGGARVKRSIGELCYIAGNEQSGYNPSELIGHHTADLTLKMHGIKVEQSMIIISNNHDGIRKLLARTPWNTGNHGKLLSRIEGAIRIGATRFSKGSTKSNAVAVPLSLIF